MGFWSCNWFSILWLSQSYQSIFWIDHRDNCQFWRGCEMSRSGDRICTSDGAPERTELAILRVVPVSSLSLRHTAEGGGALIILIIWWDYKGSGKSNSLNFGFMRDVSVEGSAHCMLATSLIYTFDEDQSLASLTAPSSCKYIPKKSPAGSQT